MLKIAKCPIVILPRISLYYSSLINRKSEEHYAPRFKYIINCKHLSNPIITS